MGSFRRIVMDMRRAGLLLGVLAFLIQTAGWATAAPSMAAAQVGAGGAFIIPICATDGVKMVAVDDSGQPVSPDGETPDAAKKDHCPLCPVVVALGLPAVAAAELRPPDERRHDVSALPGLRIAAGWFLSTLQARAPPAAA